MTSLLAHDANLQLHTEADALNIIMSGLPACILTPDDLHPEFFDLRNGARVDELIRDHHSHMWIRFFTTIEQAESWLAA